jgi:pimeloyl-ACP methyl ester carboxylesterase
MRRLPALIAVVMMLAGCGGSNNASNKPAASRAVVIVSGGDATSPFTNPDQACATGLAAGNTDTAVTLPENMTVNSQGSIDTAGEHLSRFLTWLHTDKGVTEVDLIGHSMGGLYSRAAIRVLAGTDSALKVRSLTTIGTPWQGSYLSDYANDAVPLSDCLGDRLCEDAMKGFKAEVLRLVSGSGREVNRAYLMGSDGWNQFQTGVLDKIPVVLIGGSKFTQPGQVNPAMWPNDGIVALRSALATDVGDPVLPHRRCYTFDDTHSIFVSDAAGLDWKTALTWDLQVFDVLHSAIEDAPKALDAANRRDCPAPPHP